MKVSLRWFILVLFMVVAMGTWQGGRVVFAEEGGDAAAGEESTPPAEKKTMDDFLSFMYDQMPQVQQDRISRADYIKLTHAMQDAAIRQIEKMAEEQGGDAARRMAETRQQMKEQMESQDWGQMIEQMRESDIKGKMEAMPQYNPAMQDQPAIGNVQEQYDSMPEQLRENISLDRFKKMQAASLRRLGLTDTATWADVNVAEQKMTDEMLAKVKSGEEIDLGELMKGMMEVMGEGHEETVRLMRPQQQMRAAAGGDSGPATVSRIIDISPLVTVSMRQGHSFDGYLMTRETMGKDPARFIGIRPANHGSTGIFTGVMVVPRADIGKIVFFDETIGEIRDFSLAEYIRTYMTVTEEAPA